MENMILKKEKLEHDEPFCVKNSNTPFFDSWVQIIFNTKTSEILYNRVNCVEIEELTKLSVSNIIIISCGYKFCVCVCKNGVYSWGHNNYGQLGIGTETMEQSSPQQISFFKNPEEIISLCCGERFCICICKNGVFSWGANAYGQLGIGNYIEQSSPQQISFFQNPEEIIFLCCGSYHSVCVCKNGVFSWGANGLGQLGIGNYIEQSSPQQISFFKNPEEIISFSCGWNFCVCVCKNGVFSWGDNTEKQLGIENQIFRESHPQQILFFKNPEEIISICCGGPFSICVCKNGVFSWGDNRYGQLGIGNLIDQSSPQQISFFKNPEEIISISCGSYFCICICKNGVFSWGNNNSGELRIVNFGDHCSPQLISFEEKIESFSDLSFFQYSTYQSRNIKKLLLILIREYMDPDNCLLGKDYLPWDMFNILLKLI